MVVQNLNELLNELFILRKCLTETKMVRMNRNEQFSYIFKRRTAFASIPSFTASRSIMSSAATIACGAPNPRNAVLDAVFVRHNVPVMLICGILDKCKHQTKNT